MAGKQLKLSANLETHESKLTDYPKADHLSVLLDLTMPNDEPWIMAGLNEETAGSGVVHSASSFFSIFRPSAILVHPIYN